MTTREAIAGRLSRLEERTAPRTVNVVTVPAGLDLAGAKGRAWVATQLPGGAVALVPAREATAEGWLARYRPAEGSSAAGVPTLPGRVVWAPQPGPQAALLACPVPDVLYGGARGGGKSDGLLGDWLAHAERYGRCARGALFRRSYPEFQETEARLGEILPRLGWQRRVTSHTWTSSKGATLGLRYLDNDADADGYLGHSYSWEGYDELGNWPRSAPIDKLLGALRSAHGVPCVRRATANPGGVGHNWVKARYLDPSPAWVPFTGTDGLERVFIPARLQDNRILTSRDPGYVDRLKATGASWLVDAWLNGSWDITAGGMFDDLFRRGVHVIAPFEIPLGWYMDRSFDWGSARPFSVGWWAESDGTPARLADGTERFFPRGSLFRIAEWYGWNGTPNEGCRALAVEVAAGILEREQGAWARHPWTGPRVHTGPADASIWAAENGVCIASDMREAGVTWTEADKSPGSRKNGWERVRKLLKAALAERPEEPCLYVFDTCVHWIRTVPSLPRDPRKLEDVDTNAEDHAGDETRYRVMKAPAPTVQFSSLTM